MTNTPESFSVPYQQNTLVKMLFGSLFMAVVFTFLSWSSWHESIKTIKDLLAMFFGPPFAFIALLSFVGACRLLLQGCNGLEVTQEGVTYHNLFLGTQRMYWSEIKNFELNDYEANRKIETTLSLRPHKGVKSRGIHINVGNLATNSESLTESLQSFSVLIDSDRAGKEVADKRKASSQQYGIIGGIAGIILWIVFSVVFRVGYRAADNALIEQQKPALVQNAMSQFDDAFSESAILAAIKRADPEKYQKLRDEVESGLTTGMTQEEVVEKCAEFNKQLTQERLSHASASTMKSFLQYRLHFCENILSISPDAVYGTITTNTYDSSALAQSEREAIKQENLRLERDIVKIIEAPVAETPIQPNDDLAKQKLIFAIKDFSEEEISLITNENQEDIDKAAYCKAMLHLYREVLKLPDTEVALICRALKIVPEDDRIPQNTQKQ